jgi:hypothetical protein
VIVGSAAAARRSLLFLAGLHGQPPKIEAGFDGHWNLESSLCNWVPLDYGRTIVIKYLNIRPIIQPDLCAIGQQH